MAKKSLKNISYADAVAEIERIIASLREEKCDIDTLAERVRRASELIEVCRERLHRAQSDAAAVFGGEGDAQQQ